MVIHVLEDMLRSCVIDFGMNWDKYLPLAEFVYNNNYYSNIGMSPFEALYGRNYKSLICWVKLNEGELVGPDLVRDVEEKV